MTVSEHVYSAVIIGSPDIALKVKGGTLTLDAGDFPHVQGDLTVAVPNLATLNALDPRNNKRIRVSVTATFLTFTQSRTFNLHLRDRQVAHRAGEVRISVASDESLLSDYAPLVDDVTPRASESSLRSVINYVLNKVISGAALAASPSVNADATRYWDITNLIPNPAPGASATDWQIGFNGTFIGSITMGSPIPPMGPYAVQWTATASGTSTLAAGTPSSYRVTAGKWYVWSVYLASGAATNARAALQWRSRDGVGTLSTVYGSVVSSDATAFKRLTVIAQAPVGAESVWPFIDTASNTAGRAHHAAGAMLYEGDELVPYFSGATTDTAKYQYDWADSAKPDNSASKRTALTPVDKESLTWKAGRSAMDFLAPLVQRAGFRLVCDESRVWTLRDESYVAAGSLAVKHAVNLIDGTDTISRDSETWCDAALVEYIWLDVDGNEQRKTDSYALTTPYTRLRTFEKRAPYPGPGFAEYVVRRAQGRGREVSAVQVSDWTARAEQPVEIVLLNAPTQLGTTTSVRFDLDRDEVTVSSRTTDNPPSAWDLIPGGSAWTAQPVGGSWTGETV